MSQSGKGDRVQTSTRQYNTLFTCACKNKNSTVKTVNPIENKVLAKLDDIFTFSIEELSP